MIDTYAWNLSQTEDDLQLTRKPPATPRSLIFYSSHEQGLMQFDWGHIDRLTAAAMNQMAGQRARQGNYNEPWDLGWFLNDFPAQNNVRFVRADGSRIANRQVELFRAKPSAMSPYAMGFAE